MAKKSPIYTEFQQELLQATGLDQVLGWGIVGTAASIFIYYTVWVIVLPFVETDQVMHQYFPARIYAITAPLLAGVICLLLIGLFLIVMIIKGKTKKKKS